MTTERAPDCVIRSSPAKPGRRLRILARKRSRSAASIPAAQRSDLTEVAASCARWIQAAAGGDASTVRFAVPDVSGRLREIGVEGRPVDAGSMRADRRREVFRAGRHTHFPLPGRAGTSVGIFPIESEDGVLGVVEVMASTSTLVERMDVLMALVGQSALALRSARARGESERALAGMSALVALASELVWARTSTETLRMAVSTCHQHLGTPAVGLVPDRDGWGWFLAASDGLGERKRSGLHRAVRGDEGEPKPLRMRVPSLRRRFRDASGCHEVVTLRADTAVLLIGDPPPGRGDFLNEVASLLQEVLPRFRNEGLRSPESVAGELSIAWTAHELKGPLVDARAALELLTETTQGWEGKDLLRRTNEELGQLSDLIDPLLRWSSGAENVQRQRADLVHVTRQAVDSSAFASDADRVSIVAPDRVLVLADPRHLRSAISNVVRNSLAYAPEGSRVRVQVERDDRLARVLVRDRGPGIPAEEQGSLFSPFSRGRSGVRRPGSGLGLFIARRVLEAHGGSISLRTTKVGATFVLELPVETSQLAS
jgi:signal transduction histidine kinase